MMKTYETIYRPATYAAVAASVLMLGFGLSYRVLAARLTSPPDKAPISAAAIRRFPLEIGEWTGQDVAIEERIVEATDTDAHINRRYSRNNGFDVVSLYVACGVRARDLMPHRPEVCYTGAGWTVRDHGTLDLVLGDGTPLACSFYQFSRGVLGTEKVVVLYYYLVDGQYCQDVSLLRSKAWQGSGTVDYVAQIQVVAPVAPTATVDSARALICAFAVESAPALADLFEHRSAAHDPNQPHDPPGQP